MNEFWNWLDSNAQVISSVASVATAVIWIIYLQLALTTYIKQRRPQIIIDQAHGHGLRSVFMLINLSQVPIHISCILVAFNVGVEEEVFEITEFEHSEIDPESESSGGWEETLKHGPVQAGGFLVLGGLPADLAAERSTSTHDDGNGGDKSLKDRFNESVAYVHNFEFRVIGVFSTDDRPVGARRRYRIETDGENEPRILPESENTEQLTDRGDVPTLRKWADECRSV